MVHRTCGCNAVAMGSGRHLAAAFALLALAVGLAACGDDPSLAPGGGAASPAGGGSPSGALVVPPTERDPRLNPLTPTDPSRVLPANAAAIAALGRVASPLDPPDHAGHGENGGITGPQQVLPMWTVDQRSFDAQWAAAVGSVQRYDSIDKAEALGYQRAAVQGPGVGVHLVNWTLVDKPFDPTRPSMLLFDERPGRTSTLVGYSYWIRSTTQPEGFVGPNDEWHQHKGLCVVNGWIDREESKPGQCAGVRLAGSDLWMLHAWVVPGWSDRWGPFATINRKLCPSNRALTGAASCSP